MRRRRACSSAAIVAGRARGGGDADTCSAQPNVQGTGALAQISKPPQVFEEFVPKRGERGHEEVMEAQAPGPIALLRLVLKPSSQPIDVLLGEETGHLASSHRQAIFAGSLGDAGSAAPCSGGGAGPGAGGLGAGRAQGGRWWPPSGASRYARCSD